MSSEPVFGLQYLLQTYPPAPLLGHWAQLGAHPLSQVFDADSRSIEFHQVARPPTRRERVRCRP